MAMVVLRNAWPTLARAFGMEEEIPTDIIADAADQAVGSCGEVHHLRAPVARILGDSLIYADARYAAATCRRAAVGDQPSE
jgi:hypothetical protein